MEQPNVLTICVDHWPGLLMGAAGHEHIITPTLNSIAEHGTHFTQAYSSTPTCIPARRELMTGTQAKTHGDRIFNETLPMDPTLPTMPDMFRKAGYKAYAVGKLHVYPQRDRIGFDDALIHEEGRHHLGLAKDDYELYLEHQGLPGRELTHAIGNNQYPVRSWHLDEEHHPTNWTTREMCRQIKRRDPTKPAFWYCSYAAPHPPITPPEEYFRLYREMGIDQRFIGAWAEDFQSLPYALKYHTRKFPSLREKEIDLARKGFYAQCTYIDHQIRLLIGTLREEELLDDTIIVFTGDHGDMLGNHNLWSKPPMFEYASKIPLIFSVPSGLLPEDKATGVETRFAALRDIMPTLLDLCSIPIPETVEGRSLYSDTPRESIYCEHYEDERAMRMVRKDSYKLIWYPAGNRFHLFDLEEDPMELEDLSDNHEYANIKKELQFILLENLYGSDLQWVNNDTLVGLPDKQFVPFRDRGLLAQRGWR
jgi:arylsulfatase A-like enzyme